MTPVRAAAVGLLLAAGWVPTVEAQTPRPSTTQRKQLEVLVAAVEQAANGGETLDTTWERHILRVSDGAHYVALRAFVATTDDPDAVTATYVRVATRRTSTSSRPERSAVGEWLAGLRSDPLPLQPGRSMSVPTGEMPVGGAAASSRRSAEANDASAALRLMSLQQERAARERSARAAERAAALEQPSAVVTEMLPFEDFDFDARPTPRASGGLEIRRSITAGPGSFDVYVAWTTGRGNATTARVIHYTLNLPPATAEFALSDIIVAERAVPLAAPWPASKQSGHPYAIGALDVTPATANVLDGDGTLGLVFQVVNAAADGAGKPSVDVDFSVSRLAEDRVVPFGALMRQHYDGTTLPGDFDVTRGHPLFGAVRAPLTTFTRGRYRVDVMATDRLSGRRASSEATFVVRPTPRSLLAEAPSLGRPFRREAALTAPALQALATMLRPSAVSEGTQDPLAGAVDAVAAGRFVELVQLAPLAPADQARALVLRAIGLFGLGDSPRAVLALLQQAGPGGTVVAVSHFITGAARASAGDERGAVESWLASRDAGLPDRVVAPLVIDGYLRLADLARASAMARAVLDASPGEPGAARVVAATQIAAGRPLEALSTLDAAGTAALADDGAFLVLQALFTTYVADDARWLRSDLRARFQTSARAFIDSARPQSDLVREWLAVTESTRR